MADLSAAVSSNENGMAFLLSAGIVYEIIAAACSSPQTTEINAKQRSGTLMKWVYLGIGQAAALVAIAALIDPKHRAAYIAGGGTAATIMWLQYLHARKAGLESGAPGTEF